jgi:hypothetical protein
MPCFDPTTDKMVPLAINDGDKGLKSGYWSAIEDYRAQLVTQRIASGIPANKARVIPVIRRGAEDASDIRFFDIGRADLPPTQRRGLNADLPGSQEHTHQLLTGIWRIATDEELKQYEILRKAKLEKEFNEKIAKENALNAQAAASTAAATSASVATAVQETIKALLGNGKEKTLEPAVATAGKK